jgi:hypothetical protein
MPNSFRVRGRSGVLVSTPRGWFYESPSSHRALGVRVLDDAAVKKFFGERASFDGFEVRAPRKRKAS